MFKPLCCVVYYVVQDECFGVHNGQFIVMAWWSYWIVQFKFRLEKEARRRMDGVFKLLCCCCKLFVSRFLHWNA